MLLREPCAELVSFELSCLDIARRELNEFWDTRSPTHLSLAAQALDDYYSAHGSGGASDDVARITDAEATVQRLRL
jgi:hypothetical protein